jgi:serine/threonine-protein kinase
LDNKPPAEDPETELDWELPAERANAAEHVEADVLNGKLTTPAPPNFAVVNGAGALVGGLAEGSRFGVYIVGPSIGEGGMARIYRAEHEGLRRQVALKVLSDGFSKDTEGRERFLREARIAAAIKHPNVVNIFDVGVHGGVTYLVMELLEGEDLETLIQAKGALDEGTIVDIMVPVVAGLVAVHDAGIVHRDLKPGNIFLAKGRNDEIEPKLLDFGISKSIHPNQLKLTAANGLLMGTPFYMSPEGIQGHEMTALSDQYALGVLLYECATGKNPFMASSFPEVVNRIATGKYLPPSQHFPIVPKRLCRIIERAMSLDPEKRFKDLREMGRELLLLAGQRTRITWGLSFGELNRAAALSRAAGSAAPDMTVYGQNSDVNFRPRRKGLVAAQLCLVLLGAGAAAYFFVPGVSERFSSSTGAIAALDADRAQVESQTTRSLSPPPNAYDPSADPDEGKLPGAEVEPKVGDVTAMPGLDPGSTVAASPPAAEEAAPTEKDAEKEADEPPAPRQAKTTSAKMSRALRSNKAAGRVAARNQRQQAVRGRASAAARAPVADSEGKPEWLLNEQQALAAETRSAGVPLGTNNAPILD